MTYHLCRDMLTTVSASSPGTNMYFLSIFLNHVLDYTIDQFTNFNLGSSSYLKGVYTADTTSLGSIGTLSGTAAITLPLSFYTASVSDVGRIVALKSNTWPRHNSGLFRVTGYDTGVNALLIDYRSPDLPPSESNLTWRIFESEDLVPTWQSGSNGRPFVYATMGSGSSASRATFNAPLGYHVRLALESVPDRSGTVPCGFTIAPGMGTLSGGDFDNEAGHLHGPMWYNTTGSAYKGTAVGLSPQINGFEWTQGQWRVCMAGDDVTGTCAIFVRNVTFSTGGNGWAIFGVPEDEPDDAERRNLIERLFVMGHGQALPNLSWRSGYFNDGLMTGMAWSFFGKPIPCVMSCYSDIANVQHHRHSTFASGNLFNGATELLDVELLAGTMDTLVSPTDVSSGTFAFEPRRLGRVPFVRMGRANFVTWSVGTSINPGESWLHTSDGIYMPWGGPLFSGSISSGSAFIDPFGSGSQSLNEGLITDHEPSPVGHDPPTEAVVMTETTGIDATRFQKTYSFFRQRSVVVSVTKAGSNRSK